MANSDRNWQRWGEKDPYYAVLTNPCFRTDRIDKNRKLFFSDGQSFIRHWIDKIEFHSGALKRDRVLDFGCGVGRLTIPLTDYFSSAVGVDISPAMLDEARRNSIGRSIDYVISDDSLSMVENDFDFVISCMVLQHIPVTRGMALLDHLLRRVRPQGHCLIHLPVKRNSNWRRETRYFICHSVPGGQTLMNFLAGRPANAPVMQMNDYSLDAVMYCFYANSFGEMLVHYESQADVDTVIISARRR